MPNVEEEKCLRVTGIWGAGGGGGVGSTVEGKY